MDPDLVRQQAEEEAASRIYSRRAMLPDMRVEPVLPMGMSLAPRGAVWRPSYSEDQIGISPAVSIVTAGWRTALGIAASCVLGVTVGLVGGMMLGVKLQLVPWQGAAIGAAAGLVIAWQVATVALIRRGALPRMRAFGAAFRASLLILLMMAGALFVAPHFLERSVSPNAPFAVAVFWRSVAGGALVALMLGGAVLRGALRQVAGTEPF